MSVSALVVNGGELTIVADGDEDISVQASPSGQLQVLVGSTERNVPLTALNNLPVMQANTLTSINIEGGSDGNTIDLSNVSVANGFNAMLSILVSGENGNDLLIGSPDHANQLNGGDGTDEIRGGDLGDTLNGGDGADTIFGDIVPAGTVDPSVLANGGNDTITAGDGSDTVQGVGGNDSIVSGDGNDLVNGGVGDDSVDGNNGTDSLLGNGATTRSPAMAGPIRFREATATM